MKLTALMPVRNEDWILGLSARVALQWVDDLVILNHASTDRTVEIIADLYLEFPGRVHLISVPVAQWDEMEHRQFMLERARGMGGDFGASHIALIDADEILTSDLVGRVRQLVEQTPRGSMLQIPLYNLRQNICRYHLNGIWGNRIVSVAFRDESAAAWRGDTFHHREPHGVTWNNFRPLRQGQGGVMHLWGVTERRLLAKHALYKVTECIRWPDKSRSEIERTYNQAAWGNPPNDTPKTWKYEQVPKEWWAGYSSLMKHLDVDAEPWQEAEVRRLVKEHGRDKFAGMDLFGVV